MLNNMYSKCGLVDNAGKVFDGMTQRSIVSWNTMIGSYTKDGQTQQALALFMDMQRDGNSPFNEFTVSNVLCACAIKCNVFECKQLHGFTIKAAMDWNVLVGTALLDVFAKCGLIKEASMVFECMSERSDVTWSSMVAGFVQNELYEEALLLFRRAQVMRLEINQFMVSSVISACACLAVLIEGKQLHAVMSKTGLGSNLFVVASLTNMYAKCGSIGEAYALFSGIEGKNVVLWNVMISGFAKHAHSMEGKSYFNLMVKQHGISPNVLHYSCMVDVLGRAGLIHEAYDLIVTMTFDATASMWGSLLASCRNYGKLEFAEIAAKQLFEMEPDNAGNHVLLSNIYAANRKWEEVARTRKLLKDRGKKGEG
ncbi:hypothetical protein LWI28_026654 [Acer negundo]|uniref:Pentatricopeptide repeat-containing protein n=1 Tax=Acer negundo TaxID=4023 RepID=A0AAD5JBN2_ACENE|nr:hypothetical protein LWI28_026654 [Acer negundo]